MRYTKKLIALLFMGMIVFSLSACGGETLKPASIKPSDTVSQAAPGSTPDPAPGALPDSTPVAAPDPPPAGASGQTAPPVVQRSIILSTTTSVNDSGLLDYLQPFLKEETGITLDILAQGSGQALATAAAGDADVVIAHSPAAEKKFVEDRSGYDRTEFMHNFYVIAGPVGDPANLRSATDVASAMAQILETGNLFISRGDESGTHTKEKSLWALSGIDYESYRQTYLSVGKGMGDTLVMASEMQGYTLTDVSTFLSMKARLELEAIVDSGADLKNIYSIILVCEQEGKNIKTEDARDFMDWLLSDHTKELIAGYGIEEYGEPLFFIGI